MNYQAWTDDDTDEDRRIFLSWTDEQQRLHAYIIYYMTATHHLVIERADGEEPGSICIPHYKQKWFKSLSRRGQGVRRDGGAGRQKGRR